MNKLIIATLGLPIFLFACKEKKQPDPVSKQVCVSDSMLPMITIDSVKIANIDDQLKLSGEISFNESKVVKLYPFSSGQVAEVKVNLGDRIKQGQVLAVIKSAEIAGNYSDLVAAESDVAIAKRQYENAEALYNNGISSQREFEEAKQNLQKATSAETKIKETLRINGSGRTDKNGNFTIIAPRSGYLLERKINPGSFIRADNTENMFTIGDITDVWVIANVYESDISRIKEGYTAKVTTLAYPDSVFVGKVDMINQILDPQTKVMKVRIDLPNKGLALKPEMFANVLIENKEGRKAMSIPASALVSDDGKSYVVTYKGQCDLKLHEVKVIKATEGGPAFIKDGVQLGDKVISKNQVLFFRALSQQ
ncbi:efflux RND transporter periplasmic adaptor subunit [Chitinophagaceae bacterium 26-R-25]|nr:efflux RND transporter periplasmic adaptor subunit [Chitinophagaceae bacterium 26-R-25]